MQQMKIELPTKEEAFWELMTNEVLNTCEDEGIWIDAEPNIEDTKAFFLFGDPYLYNIHIQQDFDIWVAYWATIFRVAKKVAGREDVHYEFFPAFDNEFDAILVVVDESGKCLTYDPQTKTIGKLLEMQEFDYEEFRRFVKDIARIFSGGEYR